MTAATPLASRVHSSSINATLINMHKGARNGAELGALYAAISTLAALAEAHAEIERRQRGFEHTYARFVDDLKFGEFITFTIYLFGASILTGMAYGAYRGADD